MFESDDYDQVLSQFEFPEVFTSKSIQYESGSDNCQKKFKNNIESGGTQSCFKIKSNEVVQTDATTNKSVPVRSHELDCYNQVFPESDKNVLVTKQNEESSCLKIQNNVMGVNKTSIQHHLTDIPNNNIQTKVIAVNKTMDEKLQESPKHLKRKMINTYFNHNNKRKFPGPAGLLTNSLEKSNDENICGMELLSQDVDFSQNNLRSDSFESPLWIRLLADLKDWNLREIDTIKTIKQKAITGNLRRRKAHIVTAFVEAVDRSVTDPLIIMRDTTGTIKATLHRDAWSAFSKYIAADYCALILWKPTILTTGAAFKKHYLNITLSNMLALYSSTVVNDEVDKKPLPHGYSIVYEDNYTVIKSQNSVQSIDGNTTSANILDSGSNNLLDGLDSMFADDLF